VLARSWPIATANKTLEKIGIYVQSKTVVAVFEFRNLKVIRAEKNKLFPPAFLQLI
jgi:hypothetical protein